MELIREQGSKTAKKTHLGYFGEKLRIPFLYQVVWEQEESYTRDDVLVMAPHEFLTALP